MEAKKNISDKLKLHSDSVQKILSTSPHWMIRWGNTMVFIVLLLLILIGYLINYPEYIRESIVLTCQNCPEKIQAKTTSKIEKIFIKNDQYVDKGKVLLVLQSSARYQDVFKLKNSMDSLSFDQIHSFPIQEVSHYKLGELQDDFNAFSKVFINEGQSVNLKSNSRFNMEGQGIQHTQSSQCVKLLEKLKKSLKQWESKHLLISSKAGIASFSQVWKENQLIRTGDTLLSILPQQKEEYVATVPISLTDARKIAAGQKVLIKLDNYPYQEYGVVEGKVQSITTVPDKTGEYGVRINLPDGLKTSYHKKLHFDRELKGEAEIILKDVRLIERFFHEIK